jgi:hypothetical protein
MFTLDRAWQHESPLVIGLTPAEIQASAAFEPSQPAGVAP